MKINIAQCNFVVGDIEGNVQKHLKAINHAHVNQAELIVFSELSICAYSPKDMLEYPSFIQLCKKGIEQIQESTKTLDIGILIGSPRPSGLAKGKALYNSALLIYKGKIIAHINKGLLPTYDIFNEYRYFEPSKDFNCVVFKGYRLAITICEDLWNLNEPRLYERTPMDELLVQKPDIMINLSGSPYSYNHVEERKKRMCFNAKHYNLPLIYVNQVGGQTEILFDGGSLFINRNGQVAEELNYFNEDSKSITFDKDKTYIEKSKNYKDEDEELIFDALVMGVKDYFQKLGFKKALLGLSGGIDSALVNALAVEALGADNVLSVLMPSKYSSDGSINDSIQLCQNTGNPYEIIPIQTAVDSVDTSLDPIFKSLKDDVTEENIQARMRAVFLMAISNKKGHILLNTSNKTESAVGYTTLYGDMCGGLSVIGDLYKQQVYSLSHYANARNKKEIIPQNILTKAPSAELRPNQKDSDSLPPYDLLDKILFHYIEKELGVEEIIRLGFDEETVIRIIKMVNRNEYKRFQAAPVLRISHKAFGFGRQMPLVAKYDF